jgi:hypothetical protein
MTSDEELSFYKDGRAEMPTCAVCDHPYGRHAGMCVKGGCFCDAYRTDEEVERLNTVAAERRKLRKVRK